MEANIDQPDAAGNPNEEMRKLMLLQVAEHVKIGKDTEETLSAEDG